MTTREVLETSSKELLVESSVTTIADAVVTTEIAEAPAPQLLVEEAEAVVFVDTQVVTELAQEGIQGPPGPTGAAGPPGPSGAGSAAPVRVSVTPGATAVVESVSTAVYRAVKWVVTVTAPFRGEYRMGEVMAFHNGMDAQHVHYAIFGAQVLYTLNVMVAGGHMSLRVTNSDSEALVVDAVRVGSLVI